MPVRDEGEVCFKKWCSLIKADRISEVLTEAVEINIAGGKALECVVYISQLAYKFAQNGVSVSSPSEDIVRLTEVLCSSVTSQPSLCNLRFISSLYHIAFFFYKKNHLACLKKIYKIILETKRINISTFQGDGSKIYDSFILLLKKVIPKIVSNEDATLDQSRLKEVFSLFLDLLAVENAVENGSAFLETVLYASQIVAKQNKKLAIILISKGLQHFAEVKKIKDVDSSLTFIFKLYSCLFNYQLDLTGYASALGLVISYVDANKWKFCEHSVLHGECFYLLCQAKMFMSSPPEVTIVRKMIQSANMILEKFQTISQKKEFVKEAGCLMVCFVSNLKESKTISSSDWLMVCLEPFLEMILNLYNALKDFNVDKSYHICCLSSCFLLISENGHTKKDVLKGCLKTIVKTEALLLDVNESMRSEKHPKADSYTKLVLARCANLIRSYHLASMNEEIVAVSKPFCKAVCTLPAYIFDDTSSKVSMEMSFSCLIQALGPRRLYEVLEVAVAWLLAYPKSSDKVFRLWGDIKHNAICEGGSEFLDTTIFTIVTEGKSSLEKNWLPCNLTTAQIGGLLVKELKTYFMNSTLRGSPVLAASKALESLETDVLTQVRGVVIALDVTTARSEYADQCLHYYNRSKLLLAALRKQRNRIDPVDLNCSMGELLYARFRFNLKSFRSECEGEVLRLSALHEPAEPLVPELPEERLDPDDTCDVTTRYANLSLEKQQEVLADLDTAVSHWRVACTRLTEKVESECTKYDLRITLKNLQEAGVILKLYYEETKEGEIWRLLYSLALLADDGDSIVIAVGEMLKTTDIDPAAVEKAEERLNRPELPQKTKHAFSFNKALFHLRKNEISEGVEVLKVVTEVRKSLSTIQYIGCHITLGLYQKFDEWTIVGKHFLFSPSCHQSFHKAVSILLYMTQQEKWNSLTEASDIQLNLLQVSYQLGDINWGLEQPREARCYLKSQLSIAQKLGLPLRTAQLLLLLAWVDLHTGMMADCAVKLEGLEAILNLQCSPVRYISGADIPQELSKGEVREPEFLAHRAVGDCFVCDCFVCHCTEYKRLVLETLTLRAAFCAKSNQLSTALQSFKVAIRVQDYLNKSDDKEVQISSAKMWKHYADTLVLYNKSQNELNVNRKALDALPSCQKPPTLFQHLLHQKNYLQSMTTASNQTVKHRIVIEIEDTSSSIKTPMTKRGEVALAPAKTPLSDVNSNITPKNKRLVRKIALPSSGEENTPPPPKSSPVSRRRIRPPPKFNILTPQTTNQFTKMKRTPFMIVDDDGNAVGGSSSKVSSRVKKKTVIKSSNIVDQINKKLFSSEGTSQNNKSDAPDLFKSPERKSNRKPKSRTYERSKPVKDNSASNESEITGTSKSTDERELNTDSEVFSFDGLKQEVNNIKRTIPKSAYGKNPSKVVVRKENGVSCGGQLSKDKAIDSDCSVVEGTPTPPETKRLTRPIRNLQPRRATRSNKT